jgi:glycosyltransferase involved in cell wall biosynthesis
VRKAFESREFARAVEGKYVLAVYDEMDSPTEAVKAKNEQVKDILIRTKRFPALTCYAPGSPLRVFAQIENIPGNVTPAKLAYAVARAAEKKDKAEALFRKAASAGGEAAADLYGEGFDLLAPMMGPFHPGELKKGKAACKKALQKELGLTVREDVAVIGMVSRLVSHKGLDILCEALEELMQWDVQFAILGTGDEYYEQRMADMAARHPDRFSVTLKFNKELASRIYAGSDFYLMPSRSEPCGLSQLIAMHYGTVPIVHETGGLRDTVAPFVVQSGEGLGFTFQSFCKEDMLSALRRGLEVYGGNKPAWERVVHNGMTADFTWAKPAKEYMALYERITNRA